MCLEFSQITVEKSGVLIYVNTNEPRHQMMRTWRALVDLGGHVRPADRNGAKNRDLCRHLVAADLPIHSISQFCFFCNEISVEI